MPVEAEKRGGGPGGVERWWQEHSDLDQLIEALVETIGDGSASAAGAALEDLANAMEAHFSVEEAVYFPLIESLSEAHAAVLSQARVAHVEIREALEEMRRLLASGELDPSRSVLDKLLDRFRSHERAESKLIAELRGGSG